MNLHSDLCIKVARAMHESGGVTPHLWTIPLSEWAALVAEYGEHGVRPNWGRLISGVPSVMVLDTPVIPR